MYIYSNGYKVNFLNYRDLQWWQNKHMPKLKGYIGKIYLMKIPHVEVVSILYKYSNGYKVNFLNYGINNDDKISRCLNLRDIHQLCRLI